MSCGTHAGSRCRSPSTVKTNVGLSGSTAMVMPPPAPALQSRRLEDRDATALELVLPLLAPAPHLKLLLRLDSRCVAKKKGGGRVGWNQAQAALRDNPCGKGQCKPRGWRA